MHDLFFIQNDENEEWEKALMHLLQIRFSILITVVMCWQNEPPLKTNVKSLIVFFSLQFFGR